MTEGYLKVYWAMSQRMRETEEYTKEVMQIMDHYESACAYGEAYASAVLKNELDLLTAKVESPIGFYQMIDKNAHKKVVSDLMGCFYTEGKA